MKIKKEVLSKLIKKIINEGVSNYQWDLGDLDNSQKKLKPGQKIGDYVILYNDGDCMFIRLKTSYKRILDIYKKEYQKYATKEIPALGWIKMLNSVGTDYASGLFTNKGRRLCIKNIKKQRGGNNGMPMILMPKPSRMNY